MSFLRRTHLRHIFLVVFAAGVVPYAAAMQEAAIAPSATPRTAAVQPGAPLNARARRVSTAQQHSMLLYDSLLGDATGGSSLTEPVLVVPGKPMDPQAIGQIVEDLSVTSRIIEKNALSEYRALGDYTAVAQFVWAPHLDGHGMGPGVLFPSPGRPKPMYVGGYGALFFIQVSYPLLPPPQTPEDQPAG